MALKIGPIAVDPPVVLAPMAGVTNAPFRQLCRSYGAGLYVSEMVSARALVERNPTTDAMVRFGADEPVRSVQLYGVDPGVMYAAVRMPSTRLGVDHIDLNFGCPAPKVTRVGGGAALPLHRVLFGAHRRGRGEGRGHDPGDREDAQGHRRRHADLPRPPGAAPKMPVPRRSRCTPAPPSSSTRARPTGRRSPRCARRSRLDPGARQRRHLGRRRRGGDDARDRLRRRRRRPRVSWQAVVVPRTVDAFAGQPVGPRRRSARSSTSCAGTGTAGDAQAHAATRRPRLPQARRLVPHRLPRRAGTATSVDGRRNRGRTRRAARHARSGPAAAGRRADLPRGHLHGPRPVALPAGWRESADDPTPPRGAELAFSGG